MPVPFGELFDEFFRLRAARRPFYRLFGQVSAVVDVLADARRHQIAVLKDDAELFAELFRGEGAHVLPVHIHRARRNVVKAQQQIDDGGFSAARRADDAEGSALI